MSLSSHGGVLGWIGMPLWLAGCGAGALPDDYQPPLASLAGVLDLNDEMIEPGDLRIALVWDGGLQGLRARNFLAQDALATAIEFPQATFRFDVRDSPPSGAIKAGAAHARVVAYRDRNHDRALSFTSLDADAFIDELVAFDPDLSIIYSASDRAYTVDANGSAVDSAALIALTVHARPATSCHLLEWMPRFAYDAYQHGAIPPDPAVGPWSTELELEDLACPDVAPPPATTAVVCEPSPAGASSVYWASWTTATSDFIATTCGPVMRFCKRERSAITPPPTGWPCPCDSSKYRCGRAWPDL